MKVELKITYQYSTTGNNKGDVTFYSTFQHKSTTNDAMIITSHWTDGVPSINIFVSKDRVIVSNNPLINEPTLRITNIPNTARGKQIWIWLLHKNYSIFIYLSGLCQPINLVQRGFIDTDANLNKINVSDSPFTIKRGLITKNFYTHTTDAFKDVREYERGQGTIV